MLKYAAMRLWLLIVLLLHNIGAHAFYHALILDCGSRGTRLHVYRRAHGTVEDLLPASKKIVPGLSSFSGAPTESVEYLLPLFFTARDVIPAHTHASTEVFILGTGGLRLLSERSEARLFDALVAGLNAHELNVFKLRRDQVLTISGAAEAYFAALSVNFMLGRIDGRLRRTRSSHPLSADASSSSSPLSAMLKPLVGALDLGGASTQIVFPISQQHGTSEVDTPHSNGLAVGPAVQPSDFWAASFLHYGSEIMRERLFQHLAAQATASGIASSAGAGAGAGSAMGLEEEAILVRNPCDMIDHRERWHSAGVALIEGGHGKKKRRNKKVRRGSGGRGVAEFALYEFVGTGDAAGCSHMLRHVIWGAQGRRAVGCVADAPCPIEGVDVMPRVPGGTELLAMSQFFRAFDAVRRLTPEGLAGSFPSPSLLQVQRAAQNFCALRWRSDWTDDTHVHSSREELPRRCFEAVFAFTLLRDVYGLGLGARSSGDGNSAVHSMTALTRTGREQRPGEEDDGDDGATIKVKGSSSDRRTLLASLSNKNGGKNARGVGKTSGKTYSGSKDDAKWRHKSHHRGGSGTDGVAVLTFAHAINGHELSWVLGAALSQFAFATTLGGDATRSSSHPVSSVLPRPITSSSPDRVPYGQNLAQFAFRRSQGLPKSLASVLNEGPTSIFSSENAPSSSFSSSTFSIQPSSPSLPSSVSSSASWFHIHRSSSASTGAATASSSSSPPPWHPYVAMLFVLLTSTAYERPKALALLCLTVLGVVMVLARRHRRWRRSRGNGRPRPPCCHFLRLQLARSRSAERLNFGCDGIEKKRALSDEEKFFMPGDRNV